MQRKHTSRRAVMVAFGEYVDFTAWLARAKYGIDVDPEDPPFHELSIMTKQAQKRFEDKLESYISNLVEEATND